jgi:integrase
MVKRRHKGEGTYVQRKDGLWAYALRLPNGKRRWLYAQGEAELRRKVKDKVAEGGGTIQPRAIGTVGEWVNHWLSAIVKPSRSANTYAQYESVWRNHGAPYLGDVSFEAFDVEHVEAWYAELVKRGVPSSVRQRVGVVLARALSVAIKRRKYFRPNPVAIVDKPTHQSTETRALSVAEARRFIAAAREDEYYALWALLLTSGLRLGEALGLEWRDVDFEKRTASVRQAVVEVNGIADVAKPKTKSSKRLVDLGDLAIGALREHRARPRPEGTKGRFVFETSRGGHPRRSNLRQRHFAPLCQKAGIEGLTIHGLRHSMTSIAVAEGIPVTVVAGRLGHATTRMTLDRYAHLLPGQQREAADALDALLTAPQKRKRATK